MKPIQRIKLDTIRIRHSYKRMDADDDTQWITINGAHVPIDTGGNLRGSVGKKIAKTSTGKKSSGGGSSWKRSADKVPTTAKWGGASGSKKTGSNSSVGHEMTGHTGNRYQESGTEKGNPYSTVAASRPKKKTVYGKMKDSEFVPSGSWTERKLIKENTAKSSSNSGTGKFKMPKSGKTGITHPNGSEASQEDIVDAVEYMKGTGDKASLRKDIEAGKFSKKEIERCLDYHATKGIPSSKKNSYFKKLQNERNGAESSEKRQSTTKNPHLKDGWGDTYRHTPGAGSTFQGLFKDGKRVGYIEHWEDDGDHGYSVYKDDNTFLGGFRSADKAKKALEKEAGKSRTKKAVEAPAYSGPRSGDKKLDSQFDKTRQALAEWEKAKQDEQKAYKRVCRKLGIKETRQESIHSSSNQAKVRAAKDPNLIAAEKASENAMSKHARATSELKKQYGEYRKNGGKAISEYYSAAREWDDYD